MIANTELTQEAHHVLAIRLPLHVDIRALLPQDPLTVLSEEVVQVEQTRERIGRDVFELFKDRGRSVVPSEAEQYNRFGRLIANVLTTRTSVIHG